MIRSSWMCLVLLTACPPPLPTIDTGPEPFELGAEDHPLQGSFFGDRWSVVQGFAQRTGEQSWRIVVAPEPISVCEAFSPVPGALEATLAELGGFNWGDLGSVVMYTAEGNVSTRGGGVDLYLGPGGDSVDGALVFDIDENTKISGQISVPVCP